MAPRIDYDDKQNIFLLSGLWDTVLPATLNVNYTVNLPPDRVQPRPGSGFKSVNNGWRIDTGEIILRLLWQLVDGGIEIRLTLKNQVDRPLVLHNISPLIIELEDFRDQLGDYQFYQHGFQSWSPNRPRSATDLQQYPRLKSFALMNQNVDSPFWGRKDGMISNLFTTLGRRDQSTGLVAGFTRQGSAHGEFFLRNRGLAQLISFLDYNSKLVPPGVEITSEPLWLAQGELTETVERYSQRLGRMMKARVASKAKVGWCSWYEFYTRVTEEKVLTNTQRLAADPSLGVEFIQLDDGYQTAVGDWLNLNDKFPSGLAKLAEEIKDRGFNAGIWLAPFMAGKKSRLFREHQDWFLKDKKGKPVDCGFNPVWRSRVYALDLTNPEVGEWLTGVFKQLAEWGFEYFKLDFLFAGMRAGFRKQAVLSPVETYRLGLEIIRKAVPQAFILGCGAPLGPSVGLVDAMRVSEDVKEVWRSPMWEFLGRGCGVPAVKGSLRNNIQRQYFHRKLWLNDPDCLLVRQRNTRLNEQEVQTLVTVLGMTGGLLFLSDDLRRLNQRRLEMAKAVLPPTTGQGYAPGQFRDEYPEIIRLDGELAQVIALINWEDRTAEFDLNEIFENQVLFDFWNRQIRTGTVRIRPHTTLALQVSNPVEHPALVGTDLNLTALADGRIIADFDKESLTQQITGSGMARSGGWLWLAVPAGFTYLTGSINEDRCRIESWAGGIRVKIEDLSAWKAVIKYILKEPGS